MVGNRVHMMMTQSDAPVANKGGCKWLQLTPLMALAALLAASNARADQYHYNNVPVGTRAVGMGGAFGAVADDASGVYYNPAGLGFALSNDIQGSANAFYSKTTVYKKAIGPTDFTEHSEGSLTPFFGGLQKLDRYVDGLVAAFGVYYTDGDLKDQDTLIENLQFNSTNIERYHRTSNGRASSYYAGAAIGYRPLPNLAFGFGLNYYNSDELVQEFQYAKQHTTLKLQDGTYMSAWTVLDENVRQHLTVYGMQPVIGVQGALPGGLSIGLTLKTGFVASQHFESTGEVNKTWYTDAQKGQLDNGGVTTSPPLSSEGISPQLSTKPIGSLPSEGRLGFAWFAGPTLLWAFDITYVTGVTNADVNVDGAKVRAPYNKNAVTNFMTGVEWYVVPAIPLRFGAFTNNDARPKIHEGTPSNGEKCDPKAYPDFYKSYCAQPDHIDYFGESVFIAWVQPNSQISAGVVLQQGKGRAQKLGDYQTQDVSSSQTSFAFSATHNL